MAQKKKSEANKDIEEIKDLLEAKKLVFGSKLALKGLKKETISKVYVAKKTPEDVVEDLKHYAQLSSSNVIELDIDNQELGITCKKPFLISVVSVLK